MDIGDIPDFPLEPRKGFPGELRDYINEHL
jgi:hypothetical protein